MGKLADRMNGHVKADAPISPPIEEESLPTSMLSPSCQSKHHAACNHRNCICICHTIGKGHRPGSVDAPRTARYRDHHIGADADLDKEMLLARVSSLHLTGWTVPKIAIELNLTVGQVRDVMDILRRRWANVAVRNIDEAIQEELAKIANLEAEYWSAWGRSQTVEMPLEEIKRLQRMYGITIRPVGDPAFLDGVMRCIDRRIKMLGLDAPMRIDITTQVRMLAEAAGLDPDLAVEEAKKVIAEAREGMKHMLAEAADA